MQFLVACKLVNISAEILIAMPYNRFLTVTSKLKLITIWSRKNEHSGFFYQKSYGFIQKDIDSIIVLQDSRIVTSSQIDCNIGVWNKKKNAFENEYSKVKVVTKF